MRYLPSLAVLILAGGLVAACEDQTQNSGNTINRGATQPATTTTQAKQTPAAVEADKEVWVWPGKAKDAAKLAIDPMQTRKNYVIVFDGSGSMNESKCSGGSTKYSAGAKAVVEFSKAVPADANLGLVVFDDRNISVRVPLGLKNRQAFADAIQNVRVGSGTPLKSSIRMGYDVLTAQGQKQFGYGTYSLIVVTDGEANSGEAPTSVVNQIVDYTPVEVHTVGFCLDESHELNQPGRTFYAAADSPEKLLEGLKDVLAEVSATDAAADFTK